MRANLLSQTRQEVGLMPRGLEGTRAESKCILIRMAKTEGMNIGTHIAWKRSFRGPSKERMGRRRLGRVCVVPAGWGHTGDPLEREVADSLVISLGPFRTVSCSF